MRQLILAAALAAFSAPMALAGPIERACNISGRTSDARLCSCIQQAADLTLSTRDQTRAAKFFQDPHQAQEVRQSDRRDDAAFWLRYRAFGDTAEAFCGGV
jgi:phytoene dehydrogenase-like protein